MFGQGWDIHWELSCWLFSDCKEVVLKNRKKRDATSTSHGLWYLTFGSFERFDWQAVIVLVCFTLYVDHGRHKKNVKNFTI